MPLNRSSGFAFVPLALAVAACSGDLDSVWQLRGYRILGVATSPAESNPGDPITMTLADVDPRARTVQTVWFLCATPVNPLGGADAGSDSSGMFGNCASQDSQLDFGPVAHFTIPLTSSEPVFDEFGRQKYTVVGYSCAGGTIAAPGNGQSLPQCQGSGAEGWLFTRSLWVHLPTALNPANQNPEIRDVGFGNAQSMFFLNPGIPPNVPRCSDQTRNSTCPQWTFRVDFTDVSRESYQERDPVSGVLATKVERLTTGYIITDGTLDGGFRTDSEVEPMSAMENTWRPPATPGPITLYLYASDNRGGFTWTSRSLTVQ